MKQYSISIEILAPTERVWQVMIDVERWHEWTPSITSIRRLEGGPFVVGSRAMVRQPKFPPAVWRVLSIDPGRSFSWANTGPGMRVVGHHAVEPISSGSRATLGVDFEGIFGGMLGSITKSVTERYLNFEAEGLKKRSENPDYRRKK